MSKDFIFELRSKIKEKKLIDDEVIQYIDLMYPNKSEKVLEVITRGITKYVYKPSNRTIWVALGEDCEHIIYPKLFCSCQDFYKNVIVKRKRDFCKHILAQIICEDLNIYHQCELEDEDFKNLIDDLELKF
jgi:predicted nucleic acid-binding Zn finger protein